uniref:C-type lectin domain-containing protein n=1 Tax=Plectus sambesii TaxID=2011161 RepID=A0A914W7H5_9BILA
MCSLKSTILRCYLLLSLLTVSTSNAATNLEVQCNKSSAVHTYWGTSCYIIHTETNMYNTAKMSCNDILGYSGHLVHIRSPPMLAVIEQLMSAAGGLGNIWIGTECFGSCSQWYYTTPTRKYEENASYVPYNWAGNGVYGKSMIYQPYWWITAVQPNALYPFLCEYEEKYAHEVTTAEKYCSNITTAAGTMFAYAEGSCFTAPLFGPSSQATFRNTCPNVTGLISRMAHLKTTGRRNLAQNLGRRYGEWKNKTVTDYDSWSWSSGIEQLKACPANTCSEEGGYSWFWTTPEGYKWPVSTQDSDFWLTGNPTDITSELNYAYYTGVGGFGFKDSNAFQFVICEYRDPYTFSDIDKPCLLSPNPSAVGYKSCFTVNRNATTFDNAQGRCTEFANGHLAQINSVQLASFISQALWAKTGLPPSRPLFSGLRLYSSQWYWMYPDGTKSPANSSYLPWNAGQPTAGDCASVGQNGLLTVTSCTANQWFICRYENTVTTFYDDYTGVGKVKGAPSTAISETSDLSMSDCYRLCKRSGDCTSFAYSLSNRICQLIWGMSGATVAAPEFIWFKLKW